MGTPRPGIRDGGIVLARERKREGRSPPSCSTAEVLVLCGLDQLLGRVDHRVIGALATLDPVDRNRAALHVTLCVEGDVAQDAVRQVRLEQSRGGPGTG